MRNFKIFFSLIILLLLSYFAIRPLFISGFFPMHDDTQVARVFEMGKALKDGMFPVRWVTDLGYGYGYPIFNFYAPLAYYIGGIFNLLGFDALTATKIMMMLGIVLAGVFMYLLAREFWGEIGGIISGVFYLYAPYHAVDIYVRGDVAEFWAYAFIPLMFWGFYKVFKVSQEIPDLEGNSKLQFKIQKGILRWVVTGSIGYAGVILSHNLTALMITPFLIVMIFIFICIAYKGKKLFTVYYLLFTVLLGLALSAFYWMPALLEMQYTNVLSQIGGGADFRDHFVCVNQLWESSWGFGGSTRGCIDGLSFKIGKLHIIFSIISLLITFKLWSLDKKRTIALLVSFSMLLISIFLTLESSSFLWEAISAMAFFQYPWRFLILTAFFSSFAAGSFIWFLQKLLSKYTYLKTVVYLSVMSIVLLIFYFNIKLFQPQTVVSKKASGYTSEYELKWRMSKISDEFMPQGFFKPENSNDVARSRLIFNSNVKINRLVDKTHNIVADLEIPQQTKLHINIAYFPTWNIIINGIKETLRINTKGYDVFLEIGKKSINIQFVESPIEKIANIISIAGMAAIIVGIIYLNRKPVNNI